MFQDKEWAYDSCPDIDECKLNLDDCDPNATCVNIPGSFECHCKKGRKLALKKLDQSIHTLLYASHI